MRGCFGGCTFCSITEHEGRIIQSRSEESIVKEIESMKGIPGFTGQVSDLGGPTANMYRMACKDREIEKTCRRLSCVYPTICKNLNTDHKPLIDLYRSARGVEDVRKFPSHRVFDTTLLLKAPNTLRNWSPIMWAVT